MHAALITLRHLELPLLSLMYLAVALLSLPCLLHHHHGETLPGAIDMTDGVAFDWLPWGAHIESARDVIREAVCRIYVVRWEPHGAQEAVFCYGKNMCSTLVPRTVRCTESCRTTRFRLYRKAFWMTEPLLSAALVAVEPWLVLRVQDLDGWMTHANRMHGLLLQPVANANRTHAPALLQRPAHAGLPGDRQAVLDPADAEEARPPDRHTRRRRDR